MEIEKGGGEQICMKNGNAERMEVKLMRKEENMEQICNKADKCQDIGYRENKRIRNIDILDNDCKIGDKDDVS
jgi:hypothetical protein